VDEAEVPGQGRDDGRSRTEQMASVNDWLITGRKFAGSIFFAKSGTENKS